MDSSLWTALAVKGNPIHKPPTLIKEREQKKGIKSDGMNLSVVT